MFKIIYAGTPEFALPALDSLIQGEHEIVAVYTQPDRPAGRGRKLQPGPVKKRALEAGLDVRQPIDFNQPGEIEALPALGADLMVVAAYGLLLPPAVLAAPRLGCINIHASLLPRWRGASPIQQAILAGDESSGVTLMKMAAGLDSGDMIARRSITIDPCWSAGDLHDALAPLGAALLEETLKDIGPALQRAQPQDESLVSYAPRLHKQQALVDWHKSAQQLSREVRAFNPWPVSYSQLDGDSLRIWRAQAVAQDGDAAAGLVLAHERDGLYVSCGDGVLQVTELQFSGRKPCTAAQARNARNLTDSRLGGPV